MLPIKEKDNCGFGLIVRKDNKPEHEIIKKTLRALTNMKHRAGVNADNRSGDGCGILFKNNGDFFRKIVKNQFNIELPVVYALAFVFFDANKTQVEQQLLESNINKYNLEIVAWRDVPVNKEFCGSISLKNLPIMKQAFIVDTQNRNEEEINLLLFKAKKLTELVLDESKNFHIASISTKIVCYKGTLIPSDFPLFFEDLANTELTSSLCIFHDRFSTNTNPSWEMAQPFSMIAHNGEINTISGNREWAIARKNKLTNDKIDKSILGKNVISIYASDSCSFNDMLELLYFGGLSLPQAIRLMVQPAFNSLVDMSEDQKKLHLYNYLNMEPWDGPAGVVGTDGRYAIGFLDRNGLRPARYTITQDYVVLASETGVMDFDSSEIESLGRIGPGEMLVIDSETGEVFNQDKVDQDILNTHNYVQWVNENVILAKDFCKEQDTDYTVVETNRATLDSRQKLFHFSLEEQNRSFIPMLQNAEEASGAMGDDTPTPILSKQFRKLTDYFKQTFAQVTNPPIDSLREKAVMSLQSSIGKKNNLVIDQLSNNKHLLFESPVLLPHEFNSIKSSEQSEFSSKVIKLNYAKNLNYKIALNQVIEQAIEIANQSNILIISDEGAHQDEYVINAIIAIGAIHHKLVYNEKRLDVQIIVSTATVRDPHELAVFLGSGADFVYPYFLYEMALDWQKSQLKTHENLSLNYKFYSQNIQKALSKGLLKIMSKMGVSTIASYRASQLFEVIGFSQEIMDLCFSSCISQIQGISFAQIEKENQKMHEYAFDNNKPKQVGGLFKYVHKGEYHAYNPDVVSGLIEAVKMGDYDFYKEFYAKKVNERQPAMLRDLYNIKSQKKPILLEKVEPIEAITKRFDSAGMSLGALSSEAHITLAKALNAIQGRSNSGEGGEDPSRYGTNAVSKIKQVASGRFGVTSAYLNSAEVIQIKIAQGAKPGEGGQLPGTKVSAQIAKLRYSTEGTTLISPPPHHDIYSIEDLAQLIYDLKQVNQNALISVKLVSTPGVGIVASGVVKAYADLITISGYDGGTGASPLSSIMHAGSPWELGLSETHLNLVQNQLRHKVILQTDGGLKTGLDIIKAAILGAESYGFGTAAMIAMGCKYLKICHLNNCPTGIATQKKALIDNFFVGNEQMVINFFQFVAKEVRELLAQLGYTKLTDIIGNVELLEKKQSNLTQKQSSIDLNYIIDKYKEQKNIDTFSNGQANNYLEQDELSEKIIQDCSPYIENPSNVEFNYIVKNYNRSIGSNISGLIAKKYQEDGLKNHNIKIKLKGSAGQSLGAWLVKGVSIYLNGESNDYVGKGLSGGEIVIINPLNKHFSDNNVTVGNTCLYGAINGKLFVQGSAGERFAVRNSGVTAIVEGVGAHCCEYMTGGIVVVLGSFRENFGAGMTGGIAFVYDVQNDLPRKINDEFIEYTRMQKEDQMSQFLYKLLQEHFTKTNSSRAKMLIDNFESEIQNFYFIKPKAFNLETVLERVSKQLHKETTD